LASAEDRYLTAASRDGEKRLRTHADWSLVSDGTSARARLSRDRGASRAVLDPAGSKELLGWLTEFDATLAELEAPAAAVALGPIRVGIQQLSLMYQVSVPSL
jgi:hypothetical protein